MPAAKEAAWPNRFSWVEVRGGVIWPDEPLTLADGVRVTVVADLPEKGLVTVDPDDAELIRALNEAGRTRSSCGH